MTLTGEMAAILRYFTKFGSFGGQLCQSGLRCDKNVDQRIQFLAIWFMSILSEVC